MYHLQGVVFIAVLCAVNVAVTVNVYEDVPENYLDQGINEYIANAVEPNVDNVMPNAVRDCDQRACTTGCLERGAPGGSCSLGKCRCNKRGGEEEPKTSLRSCISVICIQQCLNSNHLGGRCRNGRCECF